MHGKKIMSKNKLFSLRIQGHACPVYNPMYILPPKPVLGLVLTFKNPFAENNDMYCMVL